MHVGAARKGAAGATEDRHIGVTVEIEPAQRIGQIAHQIVAERVELVAPV